VYAEIFGPDVLIVLVIVALLFGGAKLPQLARSLGSAKAEFEKGQRGEEDPKPAAKAEATDAPKAKTPDTADSVQDAPPADA
jgi:sec-independent protein translocase protein TatA